jgi:hypothetical protein
MTVGTLQMIAELRAEQRQIDEAILVLERLAAGSGGKRRGRPPMWMSAIKAEVSSPTTPQKKRVMSSAARKRMAEAQKKRWAAKRGQTNQ